MMMIHSVFKQWLKLKQNVLHHDDCVCVRNQLDLSVDQTFKKTICLMHMCSYLGTVCVFRK